jgi:predicted helicase
VDVPAIDSVLFAAPKTSAVDIVQAVGRALL